MEWYEVCYETNNGTRVCKSTSLVKANGIETAVAKLQSYISNNGLKDTVSAIYSVKKFTGNILNSKHLIII